MAQVPVLVLDVKGYSNFTDHQRTAVMNRVNDLMTNATSMLLGGMPHPWQAIDRWNVGDGYYAVLSGMSPHGSLWIVHHFASALRHAPSPEVDSLIKLRVTLGFGQVDKIADGEGHRHEGQVLIQISRLLDGPILRDALDQGKHPAAISVTHEFKAAWDLDALKNEATLALEGLKWEPYSFAGKHDAVFTGYLVTWSEPAASTSRS